MGWVECADLETYFDNLRSHLNVIEGSRPKQLFRFPTVGEDTSFAELNDYKSEPFLYSFEIVEGDPSDFKSALMEYRITGKTYTPRINASISGVLYVGSSRTNIVSRLKQHCKPNPPTTYALKLSNWMNGELGKVSVKAAHYPGLEPVQLQMLEDATSKFLRPMFGKIGSNGK